jgi:hypothetical protein
MGKKLTLRKLQEEIKQICCVGGACEKAGSVRVGRRAEQLKLIN